MKLIVLATIAVLLGIVDRATGAPEHWSFRPVTRPAVPQTGDGTWPLNDVDRFVLAGLEAKGLEPSPQVERPAWLRRVYFTLTGLPPSPEQVKAFVEDRRADAFERVVDELLANPRYGERWAQHWLDVVRYADTHGFEVNTPRDNAWPFRDYVVRAFNEDKAYDRFVLEQLAGDALEADDATGFLVASAVLLPGQIGADDESKRLARQDALDEIVIGTGGTLLGLTIGCARCHDHKFDPITARDYYAMQAFFAGVEYGDRPIGNAAYRERVARARTLAPRIGALLDELRHFKLPVFDVSTNDDDDNSVGMADELTSLAELARLQAEEAALEAPQMVFGGTFRTPDRTRVLLRGHPEQPGEEVAPAVPALFNAAALSSGLPEQDRRLALARWIASADNTLTARVMVNRVWQYHFGTGLVETPNDFGLNGARPTHPELLDWLASEFVASGWSVKHVQRLIVLSATYRQSGVIRPAAAEVDRDVRLLWRFPSRRLEAEAIRDSMLAVSGELNLKAGGPGFSFFKSRGGLDGFPPVETFGPEELRRMVYAHKVRMEPVPVFGAFDCPDAGQTAPRRNQSTTAVQALNLFNSEFVAERANAFAERVKKVSPGGVEDQVTRAFELAYGRGPADVEMAASAEVVRAHGLAMLCRVLFNGNEFLFIP